MLKYTTRKKKQKYMCSEGAVRTEPNRASVVLCTEVLNRLA